MTWALSILSLAATVANIRRLRWCFLVWAFTNAAWCCVDVAYGVWARAPLDGIYFVLALWGWYSWKHEKARRPR